MNKKKTVIKSAAFLILLIILFAGLSRLFLSGRETLSEYAGNNPDLAYGNTSGGDAADNSTVNDDASTQDTADSSTVNDDASSQDTADGSTVNDDASSQDTADGSTVNDTVSPHRVTYKTGFYYEPLSDTLKDYITGVSYPAEGAVQIDYADLNYLHVMHYNFEGEAVEGEIICNAAIAQDLAEIFYELYIAEYQIEKITLIDNYSGDDTASMEDNNTSCFNYRTVDGTDKLSKHALGLAIDINPFYNPYVRYTKDGGQLVSPEGSESYADRTSSFPYKIDTEDLCYRLFIEHGFTWGGNWNSSKDYQHFQKVLD